MTYERVWEVLPGSANRSTPVEEEFDRISAYLVEVADQRTVDLTALNAAIALKANIASPTFTGVVTVPAIADVSTNNNQAAPTSFVQAVLGAGGALLPPQSGHADEALFTDGTTAEWRPISSISWATLSGKPTTIEGFGITNAQHAIEFSDGRTRVIAPVRVGVKNLAIKAVGDAVCIEAPVLPHFLLLEQGII